MPVGILSLGHDEDALRSSAVSLAATRPRLRASFVDEPGLRTLEPALAPGLAAVRLDIGFPVVPAAATRATVHRARRHGARIEEGVPVRLLRSGDRVTGVATHDGRSIAADAVVAAAGPWTPS